MTQAEAQVHLDDALARLTAARTATNYSLGEVNVSRASIDELMRQVTYWRRQVAAFEAAASGALNPGVQFASFS